MSWFLVLLFWNPVIQEYAVADGWYPIPYDTAKICEERLGFVNRYLPAEIPDNETVIDCIYAVDMWTAIEIAKR